MKARLLCTLPAGPSVDPAIVTYDDGKPFVLEGTVIDHPQAFELVKRGFAVAEDDECRNALKRVDKSTIGIARKVHDELMAQHNEALEEVLEGEDEGDDE